MLPRARRSWLAAVFSVSDAELMHTAGLDALIYHRAFTFGILFLSPTTVLALTIRVSGAPTHPHPTTCRITASTALDSVVHICHPSPLMDEGGQRL